MGNEHSSRNGVAEGSGVSSPREEKREVKHRRTSSFLEKKVSLSDGLKKKLTSSTSVPIVEKSHKKGSGACWRSLELLIDGHYGDRFTHSERRKLEKIISDVTKVFFFLLFFSFSFFFFLPFLSFLFFLFSPLSSLPFLSFPSFLFFPLSFLSFPLLSLPSPGKKQTSQRRI